MEGRFFLDVVVRQGAPIFQLLAGEDQPLLIWGDAFLVLDLSFNIFYGVTGLHLKGDGLASQGFDKDLHGSTVKRKEIQKAIKIQHGP